MGSRWFKTLVTTALMVPFAVALGACGAVVDDEKSKAAEKAGLPDDVAKKGTLVVATGNATVPTHFIDDKGELVGFNVDIVEALSKRVGIKMRLVQVPFDAVVAGIAAKRYDTALYNVDDNAERRAQVDFVDYALSGAVVVTRRGDRRGITTDPLSLCGRTVGVSTGLSEYALVKDTLSPKCKPAGRPPIKLRTLKDDPAVQQALITGRIEAMVDGMTATPYMVSRNRDKFDLVGKVPVSKDPMGMPFAKNRPELVNAFKRAWDDVLSSGEYARLAKKWELDALVPKRITINQGRGLEGDEGK